MIRATSICAGLAAATAVAACGSSGSSASKQPAMASTPAPAAAKPARTTTTTHHAAAKPAPAKTQTTSTATKRIVTPHPVPIPAARAKVEAPRKWSGTGDKVLGTLALPRNVVVHWTVSGGSFAVADGSGKLSIAGKGTTGQSFAASGTYPAVKVTANGAWTLTIASLGA